MRQDHTRGEACDAYRVGELLRQPLRDVPQLVALARHLSLAKLRRGEIAAELEELRLGGRDAAAAADRTTLVVRNALHLRVHGPAL